MNQTDIDTLAREEAEASKLAQAEEALLLNPTPAPEPAPVPAPNAELEDLKAKLEAANAQVATLTSKLNSEDGRRGGELRTLRESVEQMRLQMQAMADENKRLAEQAKQPPAQPEPEVDDSEEKAFAETFPNRAKREKAEAAARKAELDRIKAEAETARKKAEAIEQRTMSERVASFNESVNSVVKGIQGFDSVAFNTWADSTVAGSNADGTSYTYGNAYDVASQTLNAGRAIAIVEAYKAAKMPSVPAIEPAKTPPKPTKESQAEPSGAGGSADATPIPDASKEKAKKVARLKELDYKLGLTGAPRTATVEESKEWDRLMAETTD